MKQFIKFAMQVVGVVLCMTVAAVAQDAIISIDNITDIWNEDLLRAGSTHQVAIRYDLTSLSSTSYWGGSNGFEIYSPDGADWGHLQGTTGPLVATASSRGSLTVFQKHFYFDGSNWNQTGNGGLDPAPGSGGVDTRAGFYLLTMSVIGDAGYIGGLDNDIAVILEFASGVTDNGLTLCVDTTQAICMWKWTAGAAAEYPQWDNGLGTDGPRCWEICAPPNLTPEWCGDQTEDAVAFHYCTGGSYQLCAISYFMCPPGPVDSYFLAPPYNNGEYGSVDPSGLWTWEGPTVQPGAYSIEFLAFDGADVTLTPFILYVLVPDFECVGRVGDANCSDNDEPTIGDITYMIDKKFISTVDPCWCNLLEADINQSGGASPTPEDITIGDISILIDYLFITGQSLGLPDCI